MSNLRDMLNTWDEADSELNKKIDNTNLSTIVASATASASNSKTVEINGTGKAVEKLVVEGKTAQDGTPTPSTPVEVKGVGDRTSNIFNINALKKGAIKASTNVIENADKVSTLNIANNKVVITTTQTWVGAIIEDYIPIKSSTTYVVSYTCTNSTARIYFIQYDANKTVVKTVETLTSEAPKRITTEANVKYIRLSISFSDIVTNAEVSNIMIAEGTTVSYEPYGYKIPISCGDETKNVYLDAPLFDGDKADLAGGVTDKKYGMVDLGTLTWEYDSSKACFYANPLAGCKKATYGCEAKCDSYDVWNPTSVANLKTKDKSMTVGNSTFGLDVYLYDSTAGTDVTTFKNSVSGKYLVYELATLTKEIFEAPEITTTVGKNILSVDTEVTPNKIEAITFGDYYSKTEVDRLLDERDSAWTVKRVSFNNTVANTLEYCGLSVEIPVGYYAEIMADTYYNTTKPTGIAISWAENKITDGRMMDSSEGSSITATLCTDKTATTAYIYVSHDAVGANDVIVRYRLKKLVVSQL